MDEVVKALASFGPAGVLMGALLLWIYRLYGKLSELEEKRNQDAKDCTQLALDLQEKVFQQVATLAKIVDSLHRRRDDE